MTFHVKISNLTVSQKKHEYDALLESYKQSEKLQSIKLQELQNTVQQLKKALRVQKHSLSWQLVLPLRVIESFFKKDFLEYKTYKYIFKRLYEIYRYDGWNVLFKKIIYQIKKKIINKKNNGILLRNRNIYEKNLDKKNILALKPHILIIAELSLKQCAKYRVWQKKEQLEKIGWLVTVVDWRDNKSALVKLQLCTQVIFYRTPAFSTVKDLIKEAKRLGLSPYWEVDDLIFSKAHYLKNNNLSGLNKKERAQALWGVELFKECLLLCDGAIASTHKLAHIMQEFGMEKVFIIENALDRNTLSIIEKIKKNGVCSDHGHDEIRIVYGSGTKTHDTDFQVAAKGIVAAMLADKRLTLHIIGELTLPKECNVLMSRIKRISLCDYESYMEYLSRADITIAPLENSIFNDCKSSIKFIEGSVFSVPSICSPSAAYARIIQHGENGFLAHTEHDWTHALLTLAANVPLRRKMGAQACKDVYEQYSTNSIITRQVLPIFGKPKNRKQDHFSILSVNLYFAPNSFGGATFVAEEMVKYFEKQKNIQSSVFTSRPYIQGKEQIPLRYEVGQSNVLAVEQEAALYEGGIVGLDTPQITNNFREWLLAVQPDCVHFHSLAGLGVGLTRVCMEEGVPYAITLHDAWWLCDRQYMVNDKGYFCGQEKIDLSVCKACVSRTSYLEERERIMRIALSHAALLLAPSESQRALYIQNGISPEKIVLNKNGFVWPKKIRPPRKPGQIVRFGYVGGSEAIKGFDSIRKVFEKLDAKKWELLIVDNKTNLGIESIQTKGWKTQGTVKTVPAYTQETMDDFYNSIDVLLFPSQCKESYGLAVREALARDVWVIATDNGGQSEEIVNGENGTLISAEGTVCQLEAAIRNILKNPDYFITYENRYKEQLTTFEQQGYELEKLLRKNVAQQVVGYPWRRPPSSAGQYLSSCESI